MAALALDVVLRALAAAAVVFLVAVEGVSAYGPVLMPYANETLCNQELHVDGTVIEPSHYESSQKFFSCAIKFTDNVSPRNDRSHWVVRVDSMFIPYHKIDTAGRLPTIEVSNQSAKLVTFEHPINASYLKKDMIAHRILSINFVNIPKESNYKFVVTLDTGDANCTEGHKCTISNYCINRSLLCDNVDNCGDNSDESEELCPQSRSMTPIVVIGSFSAGLIVLVALIVVALYFCRTKIKQRKRQLLRGITYIRTPKKDDPPRVIPTSAVNSLQRPKGPGFQPAPLALRSSMGSNGSLPRLALLKQSQQGISSLASTPNDGSSRPIAGANSDLSVPLLSDQLAGNLGPLEVSKAPVRAAATPPRDEPDASSSQLLPKLALTKADVSANQEPVRPLKADLAEGTSQRPEA